MSKYQNAASLKFDLAHFIGSGTFYKNFRMIFTEGVKFFVDQTEAHWLITHIESLLPLIRRKKNDYFYSVTLIVSEIKTAKIKFTDGNRTKSIHTDEIPFTDFAIPGQYTFFLCENETQGYTLMLPREY